MQFRLLQPLLRQQGVMDDNSKFEALVTIATNFPSGTAEADDETLTFRVIVNARSVFTLQSVPEPGNTRPGGPNYRSRVYEFKLVNELPMEADTTAPTVTISNPDSADEMTGNVEFDITFTEASSTIEGFTLRDLDIENGTPIDFGSSGLVYTLEVDPDAGKKVTVKFADDAMVTDGDGNALDIPMANMKPGVYTPMGLLADNRHYRRCWHGR